MSMYSLKLRRRLHYTNCLFKKLRQIFAQHLSIDIIIIVASLFGFTSEFYGAHKYEPAWWSKNKLKMKMKSVGRGAQWNVQPDDGWKEKRIKMPLPFYLRKIK